MFFLSFEKKEDKFFNFGYVGIVGIFFLVIYYYISNIFIAHSKIHNVIIILIGFFIFIIFFKKNIKNKNLIRNVKLSIVIFLVLFISLLKKSHDDFPYYHFSYTYQLIKIV